MKILYSWLKDFVNIKESPNKLAEILSLHAFETSVAGKLPPKDAVLDIDLFPNRVGDAASHFGIARDLGMILRRKVKVPAPKIQDSGFKVSDFVSVKVEDQKLCPRYSARVVTGVKVGESPQWLKKRILACGLRPINNVVDATNYVMLELGQPLHAFDFDKLADPREIPTNQRQKRKSAAQSFTKRKSALIIVRKAKQGEVIETLDSMRCILSSDDLIIADPKGPLAIAGIKGGKRAEITAETKTVALEAANFDAVAIRKTSKRLGLRTDSSWRFENGIDPNLTTLALDRVAELIIQIAGGEIARGIVDVYPKKIRPRLIVVDLNRVRSLLGRKISAQEIISVLEQILVEYKIVGTNKLLLRVITSRRDLEYPEDIIEEVARLIGYQNLAAVPPQATVVLPERNDSWEFRELLRDRLAAMGFSEVYNYSFVGERDLEILNLKASEQLGLANPVSAEAAYLKRYPFIGLIKNIRDNFRFFEGVRIFEICKRFEPGKGAPIEEWVLSAALSQRGSQAKEVFFTAKGALESLLESVGLDKDDYEFVDLMNDEYLIKGSAALIRSGEKVLGRIGIFRPDYARAYDVTFPVAYWVLEIEGLRKAVEEEHEFEPLHKYPDVIRDISLMLPLYTKVDEVENVIEGAGAKYLEDVDLFDIYEGEGLPEDKTSMAFHLIFRAPDRTLTDEEVNTELKKILDALKAFGAEIR